MARTRNASDVIIDVLQDWGVDVVFGMPGDGINGLMEALRRRRDQVRFVQVRHEESAAFMACGYAKFTGRLGVCIATSGPGGLHLLNGLYDAKLDGQPVLAITGHHFHDLIDTHAQQDVALDRVFADVAVYNARVMGADHAENTTALACRTALARCGVAHLNVPVDFQEQEVGGDARSERNVPYHVSDVRAESATCARSDDVRRAADVLNAGQALATPGPVLVEAIVDPFEPPMPPKIDAGQAANFAKSLLRGEPNRGRIALTVLSDRVRELI